MQQMRDLVHYLADQKVDAIKLLSEGACACPGSPKYVWQMVAAEMTKHAHRHRHVADRNMPDYK